MIISRATYSREYLLYVLGEDIKNYQKVLDQKSTMITIYCQDLQSVFIQKRNCVKFMIYCL